ncbi:copper resistance protein B [Sphingomonas oligophenolica]|uniref:Copper resistance protein B n=1 Tax=Sphingomonas oligophenolica TaxID=301154 RepID=A0A502CIH0_9SPHN|nr:copper resistance protein B [Sphingomonas oligophenolica]TPG12758.1 copper resistance protein B [Sphingomonas oligophenolica]
MSRVLTIAVAAVAVAASPALAQDHSMPGMMMPGMKMPPARPSVAKPPVAKPAAKKPPAKSPIAKPARRVTTKPNSTTDQPMAQMDHGAMDHGAMDPGTMPGKEAPRSGMAMGAGDQDQAMAMSIGAKTGTALAAGDAPAPMPPADHYADRFYPADAMTEAREEMMREQGGQRFAKVMFNLAELQVRNGHDGYRWDGEAWFGGDLDRLVLKTEGEGAFNKGVESAELQALYSRAIGPYFNLQAGVRHDFQPSPTRTYATVGFEGLAPYMFDLEGAAFLSDRGDVLGRLEGYYDQRLTQRLILQPRVELNLAAQDVPENRYGAGLVDAELGLRLRYEISREFAPYVGVSYQAKVGRTADFARADGEDPTTTSFVAGVHFWF